VADPLKYMDLKQLEGLYHKMSTYLSDIEYAMEERKGEERLKNLKASRDLFLHELIHHRISDIKKLDTVTTTDVFFTMEFTHYRFEGYSVSSNRVLPNKVCWKIKIIDKHTGKVLDDTVHEEGFPLSIVFSDDIADMIADYETSLSLANKEIKQ